MNILDPYTKEKSPLNIRSDIDNASKILPGDIVRFSSKVTNLYRSADRKDLAESAEKYLMLVIDKYFDDESNLEKICVFCAEENILAEFYECDLQVVSLR